MTAPKSRQLAAAVSARGRSLQLALDRALHRSAEGGIVGDQDRLRRGVMLGLGQQVGGDPVRIVAAVGDHQHFRRAGDHVDADRAEHLALGGRDIGVAGADDLGDRADGLGAIGKRGDRLRAADAVDLVTPARSAATSTSGLITPPDGGTTMTMRWTPATLAGTAFISTELG